MFLFQRKNIEYYIKNYQKELAERKKRTKIVVVDDEKNSFYWRELKNIGYTIDWWPKLNEEKLKRLEEGQYDIIVLDIYGIIDEKLAMDGGITVLERIKRVNPMQIVVAYSGHSYDMNKSKFWQMADDAITKPIDFIRCQEVLERLINEKYTLQSYWDNALKYFQQQNFDKKTINKIENEIITSIKSNKPINCDNFPEQIKNNTDKCVAVVNVANIIFECVKWYIQK